MPEKIKEKAPVSRKAKEKAVAAPKELLRRGLLSGTEKLRGQLRDAAEGRQRQETEADRAQNAAQTAARQTVYRVEKLARGRFRSRNKRYEDRQERSPEQPHAERPASATQTEHAVPSGSAEPPRIKTREAVHDTPSAGDAHAGTAGPARPQIKTRADAHDVPSAEYPRPDPVGTAQPQIKTKDACVCRQSPSVEPAHPKNPMDGGAAPRQESPQPLERGRQKLMREQQKKAAAQRAETRKGTADPASGPVRRPGGGTPSQTTPRPVHGGDRPADSTARKTVSGVRRGAKATRSGAKATGRAAHKTIKTTECTARKTVKTVEQTTRKTVKTAERGVKAARKTAQAVAEAPRKAAQAVKAARAAAKAAATTAKAVAKATAEAIQAAVSAIQELGAAIAAGGWVAVVIVLVLCLVAALLLSPLGILFSGEDSGGQTISAVIQEINSEYSDRVDEIMANAAYDEVDLSGARAPWPEVLAVYAVKTTSDPVNGQEVVTMTNEKKELLKQVFWDMNQLVSFTSTVPDPGGKKGTTTLHITVTAKTTDEMADLYGFNAEQRRQLAELLSDNYQQLWSSVLYGSGTGDGEIVAVALSQIGNVGGRPYWSWYGFNSRVEWCACFVSWCANECGYIDAGVVPKFSKCTIGARWFKDRGLWQDRSYTPNPGDIIFFDWDNPGGFSGPQDGTTDHVGIVERVENGRVYTVEGNSGDKCRQNSYPVGYYEIYGYGILEHL